MEEGFGDVGERRSKRSQKVRLHVCVRIYCLHVEGGVFLILYGISSWALELAHRALLGFVLHSEILKIKFICEQTLLGGMGRCRIFANATYIHRTRSSM